MKISYVLGFILLAAPRLWAQTGGYQVGQKVENFTLLTEPDQKAIVLVFTNKLCPYSRLYETRLQQLNDQYTGQGVKFLFIAPAIGTEQSEAAPTILPKTGAAAAADFSYLSDPNLKVGRQFGATKTPEVFVLQPQNGAFVLRYKGAIDDNPQLETGVKESYLRNALDAVLSNRAPAIGEKRATGCMIKRF